MYLSHSTRAEIVNSSIHSNTGSNGRTVWNRYAANSIKVISSVIAGNSGSEIEGDGPVEIVHSVVSQTKDDAWIESVDIDGDQNPDYSGNNTFSAAEDGIYDGSIVNDDLVDDGINLNGLLKDVAENTRVIGSSVDIGAYEVEAQKVRLSEGYNLISLNLNPNDSIENVLSSIAVDLVKDESGTEIDAANTQWDVSKGYLVKLSAPGTLVVTGTMVDTASLPFGEGYSLIPVYSDVDAETLFGSLANIDLIKDENGNTIRSIDGTLVDNIGTLKAGRSYLIKVSPLSSVTATYSAE